MRIPFVIFILSALALTTLGGFFYHPIWWAHAFFIPIFLLGMYEMYFQSKRSIMRNFPIFGRFRYVMEDLRPKIYQYFVESDTSGTPVSRIFRSVVYQRAKQQLSSTPFGTQLNVYEPGYEWINHSMTPLPLNSIKHEDLRVMIGGKDCKQPYSLSIFNISAMSYGSLSKNAVLALNKGAKVGNFAHNTGEGGLSPHHLEHGGDIIWQVGTGYFGCRTQDGQFDEQLFKEKAALPQVKMIELKLSQGAKPGHGGILPAEKNTKEIAMIRNVKPHTRVDSPSNHAAFAVYGGLLPFIKRLRELSGGKPVGMKLCFGNPYEFEMVCQEMAKTGIMPDYIAVDGGEGGTGAAPLEFSNSIGMALRDGLHYVVDYLKEYGLKDDVKVLAAGKVLTGFDIVKMIALGADACYSARGMMFALGCIQAKICNTNKCPVGVATQDKSLQKGLVVEDKYKRIANYHHDTVESVAEILAAAGLDSPHKLKRDHIWKRISHSEIMSFAELYPEKKPKAKAS